MVWLFQDRHKYHETIRLYKIIKKINKKNLEKIIDETEFDAKKKELLKKI
jgi:hypothetical protein